MSGFEHINIVRTNNDVIWLTINSQQNDQNALTPELLKELKEVIISLKGKGFKGLVISSAKQDNFIAGTDLNILLGLNLEKKADIFTSLGNQLCRHLKNLDCTTISLINGECSNAGLDIALSCDIRISSNTRKTLISYSDIKQGHYAGFGGISYLIKRKGLAATLDILSRKSYFASEALAIGLIDYVVPEHKFHQTVEYLINKENKRQDDTPNSLWQYWKQKSLLPNKLNAYFNHKKHTARAQNDSERTAINSIIKTWTAYNTSPDAAHDEASSTTKLLISNVVKNHLKLKKTYQQLNQNIIATNPQQHIHILGCGVMGRYITRLCIENGFLVSIYDTRHSMLEKLLPELHLHLDKHYSHYPEQQQSILDKIIIDTDNIGISNADIIIEATPEDRHAKASLLHDIEQQIKNKAIILTSTACLPLDEISKGMKNPQRLATFNPYHPLFNSPIVEISVLERNIDTSTLEAFAKTLKLKSVIVNNKAGYLGTRLLMAYTNEAMLIHQSGISIHTIDKQTKDIGMNHAPFDLIDIIGIKECLTITEALSDRLGSDVPSILMRKHELGLKGKKSGAGFYRYKKGKKQHSFFDKRLSSPALKAKNEKIERRIMEKIVNEARTCLQEDIADSKELIDLIAIIITGFPVEKGGPLTYLEQLEG